MLFEAWITLAAVLALIVVLIKDWLSPSMALLGAVVLLMVLGVISPQQAFSGFSNPAPITIAALYIIARAVDKTGALQGFLNAMIGGAYKGRTTLAKLLIPVAGMSAFLNNTPIVAMFTPRVSEWADHRGVSPSRFLMPLSFATILGGGITMVGTSTHIVVSGLLESNGFAPMGMFEITRIGLPVALVGLGLILILAPLVLPDRRAARMDIRENAREFVVNMVVEPHGPLVGKRIEEAGLRNLQGVYLAEIQRGQDVIAPVDSDAILRAEDLLVFVGKADLIVDLQKMKGLAPCEEEHMLEFDSPYHTFFEVVVGAASPLVGSTLKEIAFRRKYQAAVVAIHRAGERVRGKLGEIPLRIGDTLLMIADDGFAARWHDHSDFLLVSRLGGTHPSITKKAWLVLAIVFVLVLSVTLGWMPMVKAALLGASAMILFRVLSPSEARMAVDMETVIVVASAFGVGAAISTSGLAASIASVMVKMFSGFGSSGPLIGIVLATMILTELITHNAAAAMIFPIAITLSSSLEMNPRALALAVSISASLSFLTPIGYQTNTMVYGPGGYRYGDYARLGLPLSLASFVTIVLILPRVLAF